MYIRLAAYLADQASDAEEVKLTVAQIEELVGAPLPPGARFPSWWRNDRHKMHSRAWLTAGWEVSRVDHAAGGIAWRRTEDVAR